MVNGNPTWFDLLVNQTIDVTTVPVKGLIGDYTLFAYGNFAGAEAKIQFSPDDVLNTDLYASPDDAEWFDKPEATFAAKTMINADVGEVYLRAVQSGSGVGTDITLKMRPRVEMAI